MGASYYLTADRTLPGVLGAQLDGKALAYLDHVLECHGVYAQMGLRPLSEYFGDLVDLDGLSSEFDDGIQGEHVGEETWFDPAEGLEVVRAVRQFLAVRAPPLILARPMPSKSSMSSSATSTATLPESEKKQ